MLVALTVACGTSHTGAMEGHALVMPDLSRVVGTLVRLDERSVVLRSVGTELLEFPRDGVLAILPEPLGPWSDIDRAAVPDPRAATPTVRFTTVDGQTGLGLLRVAEGQAGEGVAPDVLPLVWPPLPALEVPIDRLAIAEVIELLGGMVVQTAEVTVPAASTEDAVLLRSGDRRPGFVESIMPRPVLDTGRGRVEFAWADVRALVLANAPEARSNADRLWRPTATLDARSLTVGATERAGEGSSGGSTLALRALPLLSPPGEGELTLPADAAFAVTLAGDRAMVALAEVPLVDVVATGNRSWTPAPPAPEAARWPAGLAPILLPSPMALTWDLPAGATRLAVTASLERAGRSAWASCELVITVEGANAAGVGAAGAGIELGRWPLTGEAPLASIAVDLPLAPGRRRLRVATEPGPYGAVHDGVRLDAAMLLIER